MKLSTSHSLYGKDPATGKAVAPLTCLEELKRAGYDSVDIDLWGLCGPGKPMWEDGWEAVVEAFGVASEETGLPIWQTHGDAYTGTQWDDLTVPYHEQRHTATLRCVEATGRLGADCMVIHPFNLAHTTRYSQRENREACLRYLAPYIEAAKKAGVRLAVENMVDFGRRQRRYCGGDIDELLDLVDTIHDPDVGICIDNGHANISGLCAGEAIRAAGKRLIALHINDNHAKVGADEHLLPYLGDVDWPDVMRALDEVDYKGHFTYELHALSVPETLRDQWLGYTVQVGRALLSMLQ